MPAIPRPFPDSASLAPNFAPMSARRLYIFGGIALIAAGLLFGDIFAVFILHQNAARQSERRRGSGAHDFSGTAENHWAVLPTDAPFSGVDEIVIAGSPGRGDLQTIFAPVPAFAIRLCWLG
jgi:hypothetical protein